MKVWMRGVGKGQMILVRGEGDGCGRWSEGMGVGVRGWRFALYREVTVVYDRIWKRYDRLRPGMLRIRSPYFSVFLRIRSRLYTIVIRSHVLRRNTVVYGAYMACIRSYTAPYTIVNDRLRSP